MDSYRFDIEDNDLHDCVELYSLYKNNKDLPLVLQQVESNPRAKLIDIEHFDSESNWDINLCWSDDEKEKLGIKKADNVMSLNEFHSFIDELIDDINEYKETIECLKWNSIRFQKYFPI